MTLHPRCRSWRLGTLLPVLGGLAIACDGSPTAGGPQEQDFPLDVSGWVRTSANHSPIPHAEVALIYRELVDCGFWGGPNCSTVDHVLQEGIADETGRYHIEGVYRGISCLGVRVAASAPGFQDHSMAIPAQHCDGTPASINLQLELIED
jgi:hypothetical protein